MQNGGKPDPPKKGRSIASYLNPKNWGLPDYSNLSFNEAYQKAEDNSEFMFGDKRIIKRSIDDNRRAVERGNKNFWREYRRNLYDTEPFEDPRYNDAETERRYNDALDLHYRYGNPKIKLMGEDQGTYKNRASFDFNNNSMEVFFSTDGKTDRGKMVDGYIAELLHARQLKDEGKVGVWQHQNRDFAKHNLVPGREGFRDAYDSLLYTDPESIEGVHFAQGPALTDRLLDRDYDLEERNVYKDNRKSYLDSYSMFTEIDPYVDQKVLRILQRALSEQGYDLTGSTKKDGTMDGIWGKESKKAFKEYSDKVYMNSF